MFVENLNAEQQGKLISLAEMIVSADGIIEEKEKKMIKTLRSQCVKDLTQEEVNIDSLLDYFPEHAAKISLLLELIGIAYADESYHENEQALIQKIALSLNISPQLLEDIELWVNRQFLLVKEAQAFMMEV